jgi:thiol-disulfide isomerase/thioredoxin
MNRFRLPHRFLAGALLLAATVVAPAVAGTPGEVQVGQQIADATLLGLNGPSRRLAEFRGTPMLINVWASWCGPCRQEMASLERLAWTEHAVPFLIIGISTDDYAENANRVLRRTNASISHFIDRELLWENRLGASRLPLTVLVDADGRVIRKVVGAKEWDGPEALAMIAAAFARPAGPRKK